MSYPKVSIVVPVFGVEQYIERCSRSLFEQTFDSIEYIFVDDCTRDKSIEILKRVIEDYPSRKDYVKIIQHNKNKGLPQARRTGMLEAKGDFIINFDSDDWVDTSIIAVLYNRAIAENADVVICDYYTTDGNSKTIRKGCYQTDKKSIIKDLCRLKISWSACNKMFKRSLLHDKTIFPENNMGEDMALMIPLILEANRCSYEPKPLYFYYSNPQSITQEKGVEKSIQRYEMFLKNNGIVLDAFDRLGISHSFRSSIVALKWNVKKCIWDVVGDKKCFDLWRNTYPEINYMVLFNSQISVLEKVKYVMTYLKLYPIRRNRI